MPANPLLNNWNNTVKESLPLYWDTVKAAQGNAQTGGNPLAPRMTATQGGMMPLMPTMAPGSGPVMPVAGPSNLIFGGYRAQGGPVMPGRAYVVGERGPELMVPQMPGTVIPNNATNMGSRIAQNPANRRYAEMPGSDGSLANRGVRAIGRSANDRERALEMAMRRARSQGDLEGAARMAQSNAWLNARMGGGMMGPMNRPAMPAMPMQPASPIMPGLAPNDRPMQTLPAPAEPAPVDAFQLDPLGNYVQPQMPVPSGFNAMNDALASNPAGFPGLPQPPPGLYGPEAPPEVASVPIPGTDSVMPKLGGQIKGSPLPKAKAVEAPKIPEGIQYEKDVMGKIIGGVYPTYNDQGKLVMRRIDLDGDGVVSPAEQAAAVQAAGQTPGGVKFSRVQ